jgi:hypothetical protein
MANQNKRQQRKRGEQQQQQQQQQPITEISSPIGKKKYRIRFYWYDCIFILAIICFAILFALHQNYDISQSIESNVWGQYGSFIGGLIGTIISYFGIKLLVETLNAQIESNQKLTEANITALEDSINNRRVSILQLFDNNFNTLLKLYEETISSYKFENSNGRIALHKIVNNFREQSHLPANIQSSKYQEKVLISTNNFNKLFYSKYRDVASVHFRALYQIYQLIRESEIDEGKKVLYAKMMRSQLTEDELILLRYNCLCQYGEKMQININRFNLLKHLPILNISEFSLWRESLENETNINCFDNFFVTLKKKIKDLLLSSTKNKDNIVFKKYKIDLELENEKRKLCVYLTKFINKTSSWSEDVVLDNITEKKNLENILKDFFFEIFVFSNFEVFNTYKDLNIDYSFEQVKRDNTEISKFYINNKNNYKLIITALQNIDPTA